jgi:histidine ammonia-lyase
LGAARPASRWDALRVIEAMLREGVTPVIPVQGSVGASGDLAPLAHMAAAMIGEGEAIFGGDACLGGEALGQGRARARRAWAQGRARLINGTQFSTACALVGCSGLAQCSRQAVVTSPFDRRDHGIDRAAQPGHPRLRGHRGQIDVAPPCAP